MQIVLHFRSYGIHAERKQIDIAGNRSDYFTDGKLNEQKLLDALPEKFLPVKPKHVLLMIEEDDRMSSTGQYGLTIFKNWAKYFDAYVLDIGF